MLGREVRPLPLILGALVFVINAVTFGGDKWHIVESVSGILLGLWMVCSAFPRPNQKPSDTTK
jgi:hypothetical protein